LVVERGEAIVGLAAVVGAVAVAVVGSEVGMVVVKEGGVGSVVRRFSSIDDPSGA
jgi:hypothetical protein